jgi:hypothetical protein
MEGKCVKRILWEDSDKLIGLYKFFRARDSGEFLPIFLNAKDNGVDSEASVKLFNGRNVWFVLSPQRTKME